MTKLPAVPDFPALIAWLAAREHDGHVYPMAKRIGVSSALVDQWKHGVTKRPTLESLYKLCEAYDLDLNDVLPLVAGRRPLLKRRRSLALVAAASLAGLLSATGHAQALPVGPETPDSAHYVNLRRRRRSGALNLWGSSHVRPLAA